MSSSKETSQCLQHAHITGELRVYFYQKYSYVYIQQMRQTEFWYFLLLNGSENLKHYRFVLKPIYPKMQLNLYYIFRHTLYSEIQNLNLQVLYAFLLLLVLICTR